MKRAVIIAMLLLAGGCADLPPTAFDQGSASMEQYTVDGRVCRQYADEQRSYTVRGIDADEMDKREIFDHAMTDCMQRLGYRRQSGWEDFWSGIDW